MPTNEIQSLTFAAAASQGEYQLEFAGQVTSQLVYSAAAGDIQSALEALSNIGTGNVSVTGDATNGFAIEFIGALADTNVALITVATNTCAGMSNAQVSVTPTNGSDGTSLVPGQWTITFAFVPVGGTWSLNSNTLNYDADTSAIASAAGADSCSGDYSSGFVLSFNSGNGSVSASSIDLVDSMANGIYVGATQTQYYTAGIPATAAYWTFTFSGSSNVGTWALNVNGSISNMTWPRVGAEIVAAFAIAAVAGSWDDIQHVFTKGVTGTDSTTVSVDFAALKNAVDANVSTVQNGGSAAAHSGKSKLKKGT